MISIHRHGPIAVLHHRARARGMRHVIAVVAGLLAALASSTSLPAQPLRPRLHAFVVAHADDWQLFMGDVLVEALRREDPVLVIITDAGDAARGNEFWRTREVAALASMRAAERLAGVEANTPICASATVNVRGWPVPRGFPTHAVRLCRTARMSTAFMRLPDGKPDGAGYAVHGFRTLRKLADSSITRLDAVDSSASYASLAELSATVAGVIRAWLPLGVPVQLHTSDPEVLTNPIDHSDHRVTGQIAIDAARALRVPVTLYSGYSNVHRADNLSPLAAAWKSYCFVEYDRAMMITHGSWSAYAENAWAHAQYLSRTYARPYVVTGLLRHTIP